LCCLRGVKVANLDFVLPVIDFGLSASGFRLPATGCWLLAAGYWLLAAVLKPKNFIIQISLLN